MSPLPHLVPLLSDPTTPPDLAIDALEEYILSRRAKGDSLFQLSLALAELEASTPPSTTPLFEQARHVTHIPPPHDLSPLTSHFTPAPSTIIRHLQSQPPPSIEKSRENILEYCLGRETKAREKKPGRGGKGTLGRETLEDISRRVAEIELACPDSHTLLLSIRLSLSYFALPELAKQLLFLTIPDAERTLVQHIRRRVAGEGRYGVGQELQQVETLCKSRPALKPAFRSAKRKTTLPPLPVHQIPLPAPNRSAMTRLLSTNDSAYALELVSEYITREKRDYMTKVKWAKSGREQLGREMAEIETAFTALRPVLVTLRQTFGLPRSPYHDDYGEVVSVHDDAPFEPTVQSTTAALYVNPRLTDAAAHDVLSELIESEKEKRGQGEWLEELVESVARRFPDGSYAAVFAAILRPTHRRASSTPLNPRVAHARTMSEQGTPRNPEPDASRTIDEEDTRKRLPPLVTSNESSGWWDVVSAVQPENHAPWHSPMDLPLPPGAEPAVSTPDIGRLELTESPVSNPTTPATPASRKGEGLRSKLFGRSPTVKHKSSPSNERWNRDMVADIMGPSARQQ